MIDKIIEFSVKNRFIVSLIILLLTLWGVWAIYKTPVDAIPDLSENQVIIYADWEGRSPQIIEDQITYPLASNLQGLPGIKAVRAASAFGFSMIYVIFEDNIDVYWARSRVLERLNSLRDSMPAGVTPVLGPDGTGVGHVYWYTVEGNNYDLGQLRTIQNWYIRYQLNSVPGVAEVASIGGFVKQYQVDLDPNKISAYKIDLKMITEAIRNSNQDVGGKLLESNDSEFLIRGLGYIRNIQDIENIIVSYDEKGIPVYIKNIGFVQLGGDLRRGLLEKNGIGEVVGGIIVMRQGENAKAVIDRVKEKIKEISGGLPPGVKIVTAYDRSELIENSIDTLKEALTEEIIITSIVMLIFLAHFGSSMVIIIALPLSVIISFIFMNYFHISSNLMSLGGIAIAVGDLVDSSIVMTENALRNLSENKDKKPYTQIIIESAQQVGKPIFFSLLIIVISFAPIFLLEGQEGKLFSPLGFTKTFAMIGSALLSITLVPILMVFLLKGKILPEEKNPVARFIRWLYIPVLKTALRFRWATIGLAVALVILVYPVYNKIGSEFMPPLDEGSLLFMPTMLPNVTITEAKRVVQIQDKIIKAHPEVEYVLGKIGRAETATDPAPVNMIETIVLLKPRNQWRAGITKADIIKELDDKLKFPGVANGWTQPIINRINMLSTGVRTDLGVKIFGKDLKVLGELASNAEKILQTVPGAVDLYAERIISGKYIDIYINRQKAARYGVSVMEIQEVIESAVGGMNITTTVEGRERFPVRVRYARVYRSSTEIIQRTFVNSPNGPIPLTQLTDIKLSDAASMINSEQGFLRSVVFLNVRGRDIGSFVEEAKITLSKNLKLPSGYYVTWSGQYENQIRAKKKLQIVIPIVLLLTFMFLYFTFYSITDSLVVILSIPFSLVGGIIMVYFLKYNFSVAVWVGFIALIGVATETGVLMLSRLNDTLNEKLDKLGKITKKDLFESVFDGVSLVRAIAMTALINMVGLMPIMLSSGTGSDIMKPLAAPLVGGVISSTILVLIVIPVIFSIIREHSLKAEGRFVSDENIIEKEESKV